MKRKDYEKPTAEVVKLQHQGHILTNSLTGNVDATMDGTFTEVDLAREFNIEDEDF